MKPNSYPDVSSGNNLVVVQPQGFDSGAATDCQPDDLNTASAPAKMLMPGLGTRVEEGDVLARSRVCGFGAIAFVFVAPAARQTQILQRGSSATCAGEDVLDFQRHPDYGFGASTVRAPTIAFRTQLPAQSNRDVARSHA